MLSLRYAARSRQLSRPLIRSLAQIVPVQPSRLTQPSSAFQRRRTKRGPSSETQKSNRVPVREDHGLYAFFRRQPGDNLTAEDRYEVVETPEDGRLISGRAWEAPELRLKSFKDLHTLWYIAAREQNLLATQKEEARRMGVTQPEAQVPIEKVRRCRKTMARIKAVLNERRLAYEGAVKLAEQQMVAAKARIVDEADKAVMDFQRAQREEERPKARVYRAQRRNLAHGQKIIYPETQA